MKLQLKFLVIFLAISTSTVVISYVSILTSRESLENSIGQTSATLANKIMSDVDQNIYYKIILFETLGNTDLSKNLLISSNQNFSKIPNVDKLTDQREIEWTSQSPQKSLLLNEILESPLSNQLKSTSAYLRDTTYYSIVSQMVVTNAYGVTVAQTGIMKHYKHTNDEWWKNAKSNYLYVGDKDLSKDRYAIDFGMRIDDNVGNFIGARKVVLNLDEVINIVRDAQRNSQYPSSEFMLLTKDGKLIYSTKSFNIYDDLSKTNFFKSMNDGTAYFEDSEGQKKRLMAYSKSIGYSDYRGLGWILVIKYNTDEILKPAIDLSNFIIYATLFILVIALISSVILSQHLAKRITILRNATKKIAIGDFNVKIDTSGNDEIHDLAKDIDLMGKVLSDNTQKLLKTERLTAIGELSARIAHDLRNPLNVIKNGLEIIIIKNPNMDEKTKDIISRITRSIWRMTHQIDEVLDYIRVNPLELKDHSVINVLKNTIDIMEVPQTVKINLPENDVILHCDAEKMSIVFSNLITNSIQAMKNQGQIDIGVREDGKNIVITIIDSGGGIPENILPKIFEPLFTTKQIGTGLGLVSCRNIIERHGGSIAVMNHPTTFTIKIPRIMDGIEENKKLDLQKNI